MASDPATTVDSARAAYVNQLDQLLQLYDQLATGLALVESTSNSADTKLTEAYKTLESRLKTTKVTSTVSSAVSIVGAILIFTPLAPLGVGMTIGGAAGSIGSTVAQNFFFERDAANTYTEIVNGFSSSSQSLQELLDKIEEARNKLIEYLTQFIAALEAFEAANPSTGTGARPGLPPSGPPGQGGTNIGVPGPDSHHLRNGSSWVAYKLLTSGGTAIKPFAVVGTKTAVQIGEMLGKTGQVMLKGLPVMTKAIPIVSIFVDGKSIFDTWTTDNETLKQAEDLRNRIRNSAQAFREAVQQYQAALESLVGGQGSQDSLRKLIRLSRGPPPPPISDPPNGPETACKMLGLMQGMVSIPLMLFVNVYKRERDDDTKNSYAMELIPSSDVVQLSEKAACAPIVDSVYDRYRDIRYEQPEDEPLEGAWFGSVAFRLQCSWVPFGNENIYNVDGSKVDKRGGSWKGFWNSYFVNLVAAGCWTAQCYIDAQSHSAWIVGGHMEKVIYDGNWYILPICQQHNAPAGTYDRVNGVHLTSVASANAVLIPPK